MLIVVGWGKRSKLADDIDAIVIYRRRLDIAIVSERKIANYVSLTFRVISG